MALSITLYETEIGVLLSLSEEQRGRILTAILRDAAGGELPEMEVSDKAIFTLVNAQVKRAAELSNKRRQNAMSRWQSRDNDTSDNTGNMQARASENICTDLHNANECTNTNTNTDTNTNTITNTNTKTKTKAAPARGLPDKEKNSEKKHYADLVTLTEQEYSKLVEQHGEEATGWCIQKLDNYKGSTGKKYASDYKAILSWVLESYREDREKHAQGKERRAVSDNPFLDMLRELDEREANEVVVEESTEVPPQYRLT